MTEPGLQTVDAIGSLYRFDRVAHVLPSPNALDDEAVASFARDGFIAIEQVLSSAEAAEAHAAMSALIDGRVAGYRGVNASFSELMNGAATGLRGVQPEPEQRDVWSDMTLDERADSVRKLWKFVDYQPYLGEMARAHSVIHRILERLMGEPCHMIQDMALLKPPHIGTEKPWHQDMAYFMWGPPERLIGVWIALDPATAENGCMHVLPGTHLEGPVPHQHLRDCQIADSKVEVERDQVVPLAPGGALFFSALLHHGTPPNKSASRRRALQFHYASASAQRIARREHADLYFEGDLYAGCVGKAGEALTDIQP